MALQNPPPPRQKKGMGCFGCGCVIVIVLLLLLGGLAAGSTYFGFKALVGMTSSAPAEFPPFNGSENVYQGAQKKIAAFNQDVNIHKPSSLTLSADEINALIAHNPNLSAYQAHILVSMAGDEARLQGSMPTDMIPYLNGWIKGRYINLDTSFALSLNPDTKAIGVELRKGQLGDQVLPANTLLSLQAQLDQSLNSQLQKNGSNKAFLEQAKTVAVRDGQLVIETQ